MDKPNATVGDPQERLLELVGDVCGLLEIDELRHGLLDSLHRALPSAYVSINDIGPGEGEIVALMSPQASELSFERWREHAHENPLLRRFLETRDAGAYRFSDVISEAELHALPLFKEVYEPMGVRHQMSFCLPAGPQRVLAVALSRGERDYDDEERELADRARPFLVQAYLNAISFHSLRHRRDDTAGTPLIESLRAAGLTPREAESLRLVALGGSNHHIASSLGISHRTVGKHLERGFRKLGVGDRSSAAARVWELAGAGGDDAGAMGERSAAIAADSASEGHRLLLAGGYGSAAVYGPDGPEPGGPNGAASGESRSPSRAGKQLVDPDGQVASTGRGARRRS